VRLRRDCKEEPRCTASSGLCHFCFLFFTARTAMDTSRMMVMLPALLVMGQVDWTNPTYLLILRVAFGTIQALLLLVAGVMFLKIRSKNQQTKVVVPPPAAPSWAPAPSEPQTPTDMTTAEYDLQQLRKMCTEVLFSLAICSFIHYKWEIAPPLFMQSILAPFNLYKNPLFQIHILGQPEPKRPFAEPPGPFAGLMGGSEQPATQEETNVEPTPTTTTTTKKKKKTKKAQ